MKLFNILDEDSSACLGVLLYYEKEKSFIVELNPGLDEWSAPLLFANFVKQGQFTIPRDISKLWVLERVIPSNRQNIGSILATHKLKAYDEMAFLELSGGRCSQDSLYIEKTDVLPDYVLARQQKNLLECFASEDGYVLCFFADDAIKKVVLSDLQDVAGIEKILRHQALLLSGKVGTGGYFMTFDDAYDIPAARLYQAGSDIPLRLRDFLTFADRNMLDTTQCCSLLQCSRQNLAYLIKQNRLHPVKKDIKGSLFRKGEVLKNQW